MPDGCGFSCGSMPPFWRPNDVPEPKAPVPSPNTCDCVPISCDAGNQGGLPLAGPDVCYVPAAGSGGFVGCVVPLVVLNE